MKSINYLNYFLTGIPAVLTITGYLTDSDLWMAGALLFYKARKENHEP